MIKGNLNAIKTFIETSQHSQHAPSPVPEQQYDDDEGPEREQVDSQDSDRLDMEQRYALGKRNRKEQDVSK